MAKSRFIRVVFALTLLNSVGTEPSDRGKEQPGHSEIPRNSRLGNHRWNHDDPHRSLSLEN
jgi:hypothetical protein